MKFSVIFIVFLLIHSKIFCDAFVCKKEEKDVYRQTCLDIWSGSGTSCYYVIVHNETWHMQSVNNCSGVAVNLDIAKQTFSIPDALTAKTLFFGVSRNESQTYKKDSSWVWIDGEHYNNGFSWHSNYTVNAFEKNCSNVMIVDTIYHCKALPCENCTLDLCKGPCKEHTFGSVAEIGVYNVPETEYDERVLLECKYGPLHVNIQLHCIHPWNSTSDAQWEITSQQECLNRSSYLSYLANLSINESRVVNDSKLLYEVTADAKTLIPKDLGNLAIILEKITKVKTKATEVSSLFYGIINNIMNTNETALLLSEKETNSSTSFLKTVETFSQQLEFPTKGNRSKEISFSDIALSMVTVDSKQKTDVTVFGSLENLNATVSSSSKFNQTEDFNVSLTIPAEVFKKDDTKVIFLLYRKALFFKVAERKRTRKFIGFIMSASVLDEKVENLKQPIVIRYVHNITSQTLARVCAFWKFREQERGGYWSRKGCVFHEKGANRKYDECHCDHLTNFALLMEVEFEASHAAEHKKPLSIISYVGCGMSVLGISLTLVTMFTFKELLASLTSKIFLNVCLALMAALIVFLSSAEKSKTFLSNQCTVGAILIHFSFLAAMAWMVLEAYTMYLAFVRVLPTASLKEKIPRISICCLICYGIPAVIVAMTATFSLDSYGNDKYCLIQGLPMIATFFAPVSLCVLINTVTFVFVLRGLLRSGNQLTSTKRKTGKEQARRGAAISIFLGLTWVSGALAIRDAKLIFQYIFSITNSLQGWLIFIFYCLLSAEIRAKVRNRFFNTSITSFRSDHENSQRNSVAMMAVAEEENSPRNYSSLSDIEITTMPRARAHTHSS